MEKKPEKPENKKKEENSSNNSNSNNNVSKNYLHQMTSNLYPTFDSENNSKNFNNNNNNNLNNSESEINDEIDEDTPRVNKPNESPLIKKTNSEVITQSLIKTINRSVNPSNLINPSNSLIDPIININPVIEFNQRNIHHYQGNNKNNRNSMNMNSSMNNPYPSFNRANTMNSGMNQYNSYNNQNQYNPHNTHNTHNIEQNQQTPQNIEQNQQTPHKTTTHNPQNKYTTHLQELNCPYCQFRFNNEESLFVHLVDHEEEIKILHEKYPHLKDLHYDELKKLNELQEESEYPNFIDVKEEEDPYEIIDKDEVIRSIEEDRIWEEKQKSKMQKRKEEREREREREREEKEQEQSKEGFFGKLARFGHYLLDDRGGMRMRPLERILRSIFLKEGDIIAFIAEESVSQIVDHVDLNQDCIDEPLEEDVIDMLEGTKITNIDELSADKKDCVICLEAFSAGDDCVTLPCFHLYHRKCVKDWLIKNSSCPICKHQVKKEEIM